MNLTDLRWESARGGSSSTRGFELYGKAGGTPSISDFLLNVDNETGTRNNPTTRVADLSGAAFQGITSVTFRYYALTLSRGRTIDVANLRLNGTVTPNTECAVNVNITVTTNNSVNNINAGAIVVTGAASGLHQASNSSTNFNTSSITTGITTGTNNALVLDVVGSGRAGSFTPGGGQREHWDVGPTSSTAAMSTKTQATPGSTSMTQTYSTPSNRLAHAVIAHAPDVAVVPISVLSQASHFRNNQSSITWSIPSLASAETAKLFVGVGREDEVCPSRVTINSVTFGNLHLKQAKSVIIGGGGHCQAVDIWQVDLPHLVLSTRDNSTLGGVAFDQDEAVEYDAVTNVATKIVNESIFNGNRSISAIHMLSNGNIALSPAQDTNVGGVAVKIDDVVEITPAGAFVQKLFIGADHFYEKENIDGLFIRSNGNFVLSTSANAKLGTNFRNEDVVEYNPSTQTFVGFLFDGSARGSVTDIDAVHLLDDGTMLLSSKRDRQIAGVNFLDGDVVLFDPSINTATLHMSENVYSGNDDTFAISMEVVEEVAPAIDDFTLTFGAAGSTCVGSEIVITAKDSAAATLTDYTGVITLSTSTGNGDWTAPNTTSDAAQGTFSPGAADSGSATYTFVAGDSGSIALLLSNTHAETLTMTVADTSASVSAVSGNLLFSDNAFVITPTTGGGDNVVAGRNHVFQIQMMRRDSSQSPPDCAVATGYNNASQALKAWIVRDGNAPGGVLPTLAEQTAAFGEWYQGHENLALNFSTVPGQSSLTLQTTDVGKYVLYIRDMSHRHGSGFAAWNINGATNTLTTRPFGYDVQVTGNPGGTNSGGAVFRSAGSDFTVTVRAVQWESADDDGSPFGTAGDGIPDGHEPGETNPNLPPIWLITTRPPLMELSLQSKWST